LEKNEQRAKKRDKKEEFFTFFVFKKNWIFCSSDALVWGGGERKRELTILKNSKVNQIFRRFSYL